MQVNKSQTRSTKVKSEHHKPDSEVPASKNSSANAHKNASNEGSRRAIGNLENQLPTILRIAGG